MQQLRQLFLTQDWQQMHDVGCSSQRLVCTDIPDQPSAITGTTVRQVAHDIRTHQCMHLPVMSVAAVPLPQRLARQPTLSVCEERQPARAMRLPQQQHDVQHIQSHTHRLVPVALLLRASRAPGVAPLQLHHCMATFPRHSVCSDSELVLE